MNKSEFCRVLESGRKAYEKASKFTQKAMLMLEENYPNIDFDEIHSKAEMQIR